MPAKQQPRPPLARAPRRRLHAGGPQATAGPAAATLEQFSALVYDAEVVMNRLVVFERKPRAKVARRAARDEAFVQGRAQAVRQAVHRGGTRPSLDAIHNLALATKQAAKEWAARAARHGHQAPLLTVKMRQTVPTLIATLWVASTRTPTARRAARRGLAGPCVRRAASSAALPDGTVVVPLCPQLTEALPVLRATAQNSAAKALHAVAPGCAGCTAPPRRAPPPRTARSTRRPRAPRACRRRGGRRLPALLMYTCAVLFLRPRAVLGR